MLNIQNNNGKIIICCFCVERGYLLNVMFFLHVLHVRSQFQRHLTIFEMLYF